MFQGWEFGTTFCLRNFDALFRFSELCRISFVFISIFEYGKRNNFLNIIIMMYLLFHWFKLQKQTSNLLPIPMSLAVPTFYNEFLFSN